MAKSLEHKLPKLTQEEIESRKRPISSKEINKKKMSQQKKA